MATGIPTIEDISLPLDQRIMNARKILFTRELSGQQLMNLFQDIASRVDYLKSKYPNLTNYRALHALIGSSIHSSHSGIIEDDLPGDDSIEKFIKDLVDSDKYKPEEDEENKPI